MKNLKVTALAALLAVGLAGCGPNENPGEEQEQPEPVTLSSVTLDTSAATKVFAKDSTLDTTGVKLVATYSDGTTSDLEFTVTAPDMTTVGEGKDVVVKYTVDGVEQEKKYQIDVTYWSEDDLDAFYDWSYVGNVGAFPYLPGMVVEATEEDFKIKLANANDSVLEKYVGMLLDFSETEDVGGTEVTYAINALDLESLGETKDAANYAGVTEESVYAFTLIPSRVSKGSHLRAYNQDEYLVLGLDEQSNMILTNKFVDETFFTNMGFPLEAFPLDGMWSFGIGLLDDFNTYFNSHTYGIGDMYSYCAEGLFAFPSIASESEDADFCPIDLKGCNPLVSTYDAYDFALGGIFYGGTEAEKTAWLQGLVAKGFEAKDPVTRGEVQYDRYEYSDNYVGTFHVEASPYFAPKKAGDLGYYMGRVYFIAPEKNVTKQERLATEVILPKFGATADDVEWDRSKASKFIISASGEFSAGSDPLTNDDALDLVATKLGADFALLESPENDEQAGTISAKYCYKSTFLASVTLKVIEKEGSYFISISFTVENYTTVPEGLTLAQFAVDFGDLYYIDFETGDGFYYAIDDYWATKGYSNAAAASIAKQTIEPYLPYYAEFFKIDNYATLNNVPAVNVMYRTADDNFTLNCYFTDVVDTSGDEPVLTGVSITFIVEPTTEITMPTGVTPEATIAMAFTAITGKTAVAGKHYGEVAEGIFMTGSIGYDSYLYGESKLTQSFYYEIADSGISYLPIFFDVLGGYYDDTESEFVIVAVSIDGAITAECHSYFMDAVEYTGVPDYEGYYVALFYLVVYATPAE